MLRTIAALLTLLLLTPSVTALAKGKKRKRGGNPAVELVTSMGKIRIELFADKAPKSVANFLRYVKEGHYDGIIQSIIFSLGVKSLALVFEIGIKSWKHISFLSSPFL